ncbi:hypothetical protein LCUFL03_P40005 [Latilactobacillus curvatus]|nr:hypothetical protein LCUFL03_P40005 [Latilactobacillus curvatus]
MSGHLTRQKIVRNVGLPLVNQFLAQGYALVRILSALTNLVPITTGAIVSPVDKKSVENP